MELSSPNPFIQYRDRLDSYAAARSAGWSDQDFVDLVESLDSAIAEVDGAGFRVTPTTNEQALATALAMRADRLWIKDDTGNVAGSHKARHLFGVVLHHAVASVQGELAIASCGNAALAAAVLAKAAERPIEVFIPTWADPVVAGKLERLDARITVCERRPGEDGDPTYLRFAEAVRRGSVPFSCQSTMTPTTLDGGRTIGWELADQLRDGGVGRTVRLFVQIGGGALASAAWMGLQSGGRFDAVLHPVQTEACAPLARAWDLLAGSGGDVTARLALAADQPERFMWPWEDVGTSAASGILDDLTYDWLTVIGPTLTSGGWPVTVTEDTILEAHRLARSHTTIRVDPTGSAGLAGVVNERARGTLAADADTVALFTGIER